MARVLEVRNTSYRVVYGLCKSVHSRFGVCCNEITTLSSFLVMQLPDIEMEDSITATFMKIEPPRFATKFKYHIL